MTATNIVTFLAALVLTGWLGWALANRKGKQ